MKKEIAAVAQVKPEAQRHVLLEKMADYASSAARQNAKLILFPEALVGGYPRGDAFGCSVGSRAPEGRKSFQRYWESAVDIDGPDMEALSKIAADNKIYLVTGIIERDKHTLYCTIVFFDPSGKYLGKHRKLMPTGSERLIWGFGNGSTMPVFDTEIGKMGAVICWENYLPLLRTAYYAEGIELYLAPTADGRETWLPTMRHIAMEGRCFVLTCNQIAHKSDYPEIYGAVAPEEDVLISTGGSCIVDPMGNVLAGPDYENEVLLTAELDRGLIAQGKFDMDVVGHYGRPDVFQLFVNRTDVQPVTSYTTAPNVLDSDTCVHFSDK